MTKGIDAFGLRSLSKLLTLSALVKPEKSLLFLEGIATNTLGTGFTDSGFHWHRYLGHRFTRPI